MSLADRFGALGLAGQWIIGLLVMLLLAGLLLALSLAGNAWISWFSRGKSRGEDTP